MYGGWTRGNVSTTCWRDIESTPRRVAGTIAGVSASESLAAALAAGPVVLDGGLSNQLQAQGHDLSDALWTARLLRDDPDAVRAAHRAYFAAGAQVVITASYQASFPGFAAAGLSPAETAGLLRRSVDLARSAAAETTQDRPLWIAASVGPYGATLADGSEYRGRYGLSVAELERFHRPRLEILAQAGPDVFAVETIPDTDEAEAILTVAADLGVPLWLSYTVSGQRTRAGQPLAEAFALAAGSDSVIATGVNCCAPADVAAAVRLAAEITGKPALAYPNTGEAWNATAREWMTDLAADAWLDRDTVRAWLDAGARLIGGCCRVGPEQIAELAELINRS